MKKPMPSITQAMRLAAIWGDGRPCDVTFDGKNDSVIDLTIRACINKGWLAPRGARRPAPSPKYYYVEHFVTDEGLFALERYLFSIRLKPAIRKVPS